MSSTTFRQMLEKIGELYGIDAVRECVVSRFRAGAPSQIELDANLGGDLYVGNILGISSKSFLWSASPSGTDKRNEIQKELEGLKISRLMACDMEEWRLRQV